MYKMLSNEDVYISLGGFLDYVSLARLRVVDTRTNELHKSLSQEHMTVVGMADISYDKWYNCFVCRRKTADMKLVYSNTDKYQVCGTCKPGSVYRCSKCGIERFMYFMECDSQNMIYCGNGICSGGEGYAITVDGFAGGKDSKGNIWDEPFDLSWMPGFINDSITDDQMFVTHHLTGLALYYDEKSERGRCDSCFTIRKTDCLVSLPICPLMNRFGVFCVDRKCRPIWHDWSIEPGPFAFDESWRPTEDDYGFE